MATTTKLNLNVIGELHGALLALTGRPVIVRGEKSDSTVLQSYSLGAKVRWNIAKNIRILKAQLDDLEEARKGLVKQMSPEGTDSVPKEKHAEFFKELAKLRDEDIEVAGLLKLKETDLIGDTNPNDIPFDVLQALSPILEDAVPVDAPKA